MKRIISLVLVMLMCSMTLASCFLTQIICKHDDPSRIVIVPRVEPTQTENGLTEGMKCTACGTMVVPQIVIAKLGGEEQGQYKLGLGVCAGDFSYGRINLTVASVVLNSEGKIVECRIDAVYNGYNADYDNQEIYINNFKTKAELGYDYLMSTYGQSTIGNNTVKEWFEQARAFEQWVVGKTANEVAHMELQTMPNGYIISADEDLLNAGCTIMITDFINAVVKACNDEQGMKFEANAPFTVGLGINNMDNGSSISSDDGASIKMISYIATSVIVNGKIVAALNDAAYTAVEFNIDGEVINDGSINFKTNRELKENHGMSNLHIDNNGDGICLEWYIQSNELSKYVVGMNESDLKNMRTQTVNGHTISADEALLNAGCTIDITYLQDVLVESVTNAR